jgi:DNA-binding PadR family transcriptional regulator
MTRIRMTQATSLVLHALAAGHGHGFLVMEATGLASGTVYPVLRRLEEAGAVTSAWEDGTEARAAGRPRRRLYRLTPRGREHAAEAARRLRGAVELLGGLGDAVE